jgi:NMD protein affecting ribosome stability and mRNA decay
MSNSYCPTCGALVLEKGMCELCKLAMDRLVEKKLGGVKGD